MSMASRWTVFTHSIVLHDTCVRASGLNPYLEPYRVSHCREAGVLDRRVGWPPAGRGSRTALCCTARASGFRVNHYMPKHGHKACGFTMFTYSIVLHDACVGAVGLNPKSQSPSLQGNGSKPACPRPEGTRVHVQCFAKCLFTCQFDLLSDQLCQSLDRLSDHFAKHCSCSSLMAASCTICAFTAVQQIHALLVQWMAFRRCTEFGSVVFTP